MMKDEYATIRRLLPTDLPLFSSLVETRNQQEGRKGHPHALLALQNMSLESLTIFIAESTQKDKPLSLLGYISIQWIQEFWSYGREAFISDFYVHSLWRHKSIGSQLLMAATEEAHKQKASRIFLEHNRTNPLYGFSFYTKRGWEEKTDIAIFESV